MHRNGDIGRHGDPLETDIGFVRNWAGSWHNERAVRGSLEPQGCYEKPLLKILICYDIVAFDRGQYTKVLCRLLRVCLALTRVFHPIGCVLFAVKIHKRMGPIPIGAGSMWSLCLFSRTACPGGPPCLLSQSKRPYARFDYRNNCASRRCQSSSAEPSRQRPG
jgi:hypothetical protein